MPGHKEKIIIGAKNHHQCTQADEHPVPKAQVAHPIKKGGCFCLIGDSGVAFFVSPAIICPFSFGYQAPEAAFDISIQMPLN